jgi:nucleoid DNA-binding protein
MQLPNDSSNEVTNDRNPALRQANKSILADSIAQELNLPRRTAAIVLDTVLESVSDLLKQRGKLTIKGFGTFERKIRKGRSYTHPLTRQSIRVEDKETITFRVSDQLNDLTRSESLPQNSNRVIDPNDLSHF